MTLLLGTLTWFSVHPASPVLLTRSGPKKSKKYLKWVKVVKKINQNPSQTKTYLKFENQLRGISSQTLLIMSFTRSNYFNKDLLLYSLLSWGKLRREPATRKFDWSFAAIPTSDERFARQYRYEPPPGFLLASFCAGIDHFLSGPRSRTKSKEMNTRLIPLEWE